MTGTDVPILFPSEDGTAKSQLAGNGSAAGERGGAGGARTHDRQIMSPLL